VDVRTRAAALKTRRAQAIHRTMAPPARSGYRFTDPLGAAAGTHARPAALLVRRALMGLYAVGSATLWVTLLTPDSDTSDHAGIAAVAAVMGALALGLKLWRSPPPELLLALFPLGTAAISVLVAVARPIALIPMFYIWPIVLSAYFLQRRQGLGMFVLTAAGFGVALVGWVEPDARMIQWVSVVVVTAVLGVLIVALKEGLEATLTRLHVLAAHDPLTGALNRRAFGDALTVAVGRAQRGEGGCAVAILDIDHFKRVNDVHGHAAGDRALQRLTALLRERTRAGDVVGRLGGEEFAVLLDGTDADGAVVFAQDVRRALATGGEGPAFTVSVGVAALGDGEQAAEEMLVAADRALYAAKDAGRDRVVPARSVEA
jgi:diguanylate cyclase (GGDEF)-like protein